MTGFLYMLYIPERAYPLLLFALVTLAHAPALDSGFHCDDRHSLLDNPHIGDLGKYRAYSPIPPLFPQIRPLRCTCRWC